MITLTLSKLPGGLQSEFITSLLNDVDAIILTTSSISLAFNESPFSAQPFVRESDLTMCGGTAHDSWQVISDQQWCSLLLNATKNVNW
ncbi:hypothetical protein [Reinekea sp.]|jgi:hypothetical protein|uniref:hypothetical protein n=1 Tax=Reinekea sp. TaxID=1970455 RepID=UPI003988EDDF